MIGFKVWDRFPFLVKILLMLVKFWDFQMKWNIYIFFSAVDFAEILQKNWVPSKKLHYLVDFNCLWTILLNFCWIMFLKRHEFHWKMFLFFTILVAYLYLDLRKNSKLIKINKIFSSTSSPQSYFWNSDWLNFSSYFLDIEDWEKSRR